MLEGAFCLVGGAWLGPGGEVSRAPAFESAVSVLMRELR